MVAVAGMAGDSTTMIGAVIVVLLSTLLGIGLGVHSRNSSGACIDQFALVDRAQGCGTDRPTTPFRPQNSESRTASSGTTCPRPDGPENTVGLSAQAVRSVLSTLFTHPSLDSPTPARTQTLRQSSELRGSNFRRSDERFGARDVLRDFRPIRHAKSYQLSGFDLA